MTQVDEKALEAALAWMSMYAPYAHMIALRAALEAAKPPAPKPAPSPGTQGSGAPVKPLEWRHFDSGDACARTDVGLSYFAHKGGSWCHRNGEPMPAGTTLEEAKAAAQADFEQRIRSALDASPSPAQGETR